MAFVSRGFSGRRRSPGELADRLPPGQYDERGFPVLTAGPTPDVATEDWTLAGWAPAGTSGGSEGRPAPSFCFGPRSDMAA
jgi:hypothetical protein